MENNYKIKGCYEKLNVREKFEEKGISEITTQELIMLILGSGIKGCPIEELAWKVLVALDFRDSDELYEHLRKIKGMGKTKAISICACLELGKRLESTSKKFIKTSSDVVPLVNHYALESTEYFICISLNSRNEIIKISEICKGSANVTRINPKDVFSQILKDNGNAAIFVHNHPSGNVTPSQNDLELTKSFISAGFLLGIPILDHIIIGLDAYYSMADSGVLEKLIE